MSDFGSLVRKGGVDVTNITSVESILDLVQ